MSFKKKFSIFFFRSDRFLQVKFYRYHLNIYHQMQIFTNILFQQIYDFYILILLQSRLRMGKINLNIITNVVADLAFLNSIYSAVRFPNGKRNRPKWRRLTSDYNWTIWFLPCLWANLYLLQYSSNLIPRQEFRMGLEGRESSPKSNEQIMMHFCKTQKRSLISVKNFFFLAEKIN